MTEPARLSHVPGSPFARAARILVLEWELPVELVEVSFPPPEALFDRTPFGQVPLLEFGSTTLFPTLPVLNWLSMQADCPQDIHDPLRDLQVMLTICQMGDALAAAYYQAWAGLGPVAENRLGFDPAERHLIRAGKALDWLGPRLTPAVSPPWITFACLLLWAEDRGGFAWRARCPLVAQIDSFAQRDSFGRTAPPPW